MRNTAGGEMRDEVELDEVIAATALSEVDEAVALATVRGAFVEGSGEEMVVKLVKAVVVRALGSIDVTNWQRVFEAVAKSLWDDPEWRPRLEGMLRQLAEEAKRK